MRSRIFRPKLAWVLAWACIVTVIRSGTTQPPKDDSKARPKLIIAEPLGVAPGKPTRVKVRGLRLESVAAVRCHDPKGQVKLIGKPTKVSLPNAMLVNQTGDMQIEIELLMPPDRMGQEFTLSAITASGESEPLRLQINDSVAPVIEKEPNNGFQTAQALLVSAVVEGLIHQPQDVDVYQVQGIANQRVVIELQATRYGSALDPLLTIYDSGRQMLAVSREFDRSIHTRVEVVTPSDGTFFIVVQDANDQGGPAHRYRLTITPSR